MKVMRVGVLRVEDVNMLGHVDVEGYECKGRRKEANIDRLFLRCGLVRGWEEWFYCGKWDIIGDAED